MTGKKLLLVTVILGVFFLSFSIASAEILETILTEDWEGGMGDWSVDNGVWQVGIPTSGPGAAHGGSQCAATTLNDIHPGNQDSRLITPIFPQIVLPTVTGMEEIHLRFWHWFSYSRSDSGQVQVREWDSTMASWGPWENEGTVVVNTSGWSLKDVDLTGYAGKTVEIAFYHTASCYYSDCSDTSTGWYIDDVTVVVKLPEFTGDFESGWDDWSADRGVWQIGTPTAGPNECRTGDQCAGTTLDGTHPGNTDSGLISATYQLPTVIGAEGNLLRFWHWYSLSRNDVGYVQISVFDEINGWSDWETIATFSGVSGGWTRSLVNLSAYAGQKIRIRFFHTAACYYSNCSDTSTGWYIDNIRLPGIYLWPCEGDFDNDCDEDGSDLARFAADFGRTDCSLEDFCTGDFEQDSDVDGSDLAKFAADFGKTDCCNSVTLE